MRQVHRIKFIQETSSEVYNADTGEWEDGTTEFEVVPSFVMDLGIERSVQMFGVYRSGRKVVILRQAFKKPFSWVEIDDLRYLVVSERLDGRALYLERDNHVNN